MSDNDKVRYNLIHKGFTPTEWRELNTSIVEALEYIESNYEHDHDGVMEDPTDVIDYLKAAQEILNG